MRGAAVFATGTLHCALADVDAAEIERAFNLRLIIALAAVEARPRVCGRVRSALRLTRQLLEDCLPDATCQRRRPPTALGEPPEPWGAEEEYYYQQSRLEDGGPPNDGDGPDLTEEGRDDVDAGD